MKGWTKGPYEVVGSRVCTVGNDRTRVVIADTRPGSAFAMDAEQEADAKLLAMAPEMARALQGLVNTLAMFGEVEGFPSMGPECWAAIDDGRKVLERLGSTADQADGTTRTSMKAIALVVIHGGVAGVCEPSDVDVRIVDLDGIKAGDPPVELPAGQGFEALCMEAGLDDKAVRFVQPDG